MTSIADGSRTDGMAEELPDANESHQPGLSDGDSPLGLTEAFASVSPNDYDDPVGLTQAFGPLDGSNLASGAGAGEGESADDASGISSLEREGEAASDEDDVAQPSSHGRHARPEGTTRSGESDQDADADAGARGSADAADNACPGDEQAVDESGRVERGQRARQMRRTLIIAIILLVVLVGALAFFGHRFVTESQKLGVEQARQQSVDKTDETLGHGDGKDAGSAAIKTTEVPAVASVLGLKRDAAVDSLGHGAKVTSTRAVDDAESAIKSNATVTLTSEPVDSKTGAPSVYLGMDGSDTVIQVGYSAATSALGYGTLSFADAVGTEHVIEKTLRAAGIDVADGTAKLPADKAAYTTFAADGKTAVKERCSFSGQIVIGGQECTWSAVLSYDYVTANLTGDVADTVRSIYVYATAHVEAPTAESKAAGAA